MVNGVVKLTEVVVGKRQPGTVEINSGLESGDIVVTEGQIKLRDGAPVMVLGSGRPDDQKKPPPGDTPQPDRKR